MQENKAKMAEEITKRLGMSVEEYSKMLRASEQPALDRLGMTVEEFRKITMAAD